MSTTDLQTTPVTFSANAAKRVMELVAIEGNPDLNLRVYITGGGCSGFQYGFTFDAEIRPDDCQIEAEGARLIVDPLSLQYLMGAEIDYKNNLQGAQFVVQNPNAKSTCGCGSSFSI